MRNELAILQRDVCTTFRYTGESKFGWLGPWECGHGTRFRAYQVNYGQYIPTPSLLLQQVHSYDKLETERFNGCG